MSETLDASYEEPGPEEETGEVPVIFLHQVERHYRQGDETLNILTDLVQLSAGPKTASATRSNKTP